MTNTRTYLIDFDSTLIQVEALDILAGIVMEENEQKIEIEKLIAAITNEAMEGRLSFDKALKRRLLLLNISRDHLSLLIKILLTKISTSFRRNESFLRSHRDNIYIISGGFKEYIIPVISSLGLRPDHVYANDFLFDETGYVAGHNEANPLSQPKGKVTTVKSLHLQGEVIVIGDGYTDYEIREANLANIFCLFTENIERTNLIDKADLIAKKLDDIIAK